MSDNTTLKVGGSKSWNKKSVIFRKPSMERSPKGFFSVTRVFVVEFKLSENDSLKLKCVGNQTVAQIKENLLVSNLLCSIHTALHTPTLMVFLLSI